MTQNQSQKIRIQDQTLLLLPQKAMFWKEQDMLIVSDVHWGKSAHFRKNGIAIPDTVNQSNIKRLNGLVEELRPKTILFLGDLFHSDPNEEIERFGDWRKSHASISMILTIGNHDLLTRFEYEKMELECVNRYQCGPFLFLHDEAEKQDKGSYTISGHIHPAVQLKSKGRQSLHVPCFFFGNQQAILPAFGAFTGTYHISPAQNDTVFAIVEDSIVKISPKFR
ncbi:ligase-associated DNA damage response endonuclease PdeM [Gracilimonas mengyeensis]|uniref:Putative phosphoesterase n=1 Tax=Gracilimonas mengyeensis TaxID=1302730 RepID=A0A521DR97_9BACT|nr:ligase-associated DNA damage response endonuclease PdeM [Gracilimonas mengyeensis]SMO74233.1 putative phosphoesterase [Gracilimonas mengyeensis]